MRISGPKKDGVTEMEKMTQRGVLSFLVSV